MCLSLLMQVVLQVRQTDPLQTASIAARMSLYGMTHQVCKHGSMA